MARDSDRASLIYRYWGKARNRDEQGDEYHLLVYHCLDVAAVAARWWDNSTALRRLFSRQCDQKQVKAWLLFFVALHDLGKFDVRFQCKARSVWLSLNPEDRGRELPADHDCRGYDHGSAGLYWFLQDHPPDDDDGFGDPVWPFPGWHPWLEAVCGHHGTLRQVADVISAPLSPGVELGHLVERDREARLLWLQILESLFLIPAGLSLDDSPPPPSPLLAGFCSVSDWLGSWQSDDTFSYDASPPSDDTGLSTYFEARYHQDAAIVLKRSGLLGQACSGADVKFLLPAGAQPRQLQILVSDLPEQPGITLVEAPTGSGKTEMALAYAWRLLEAGLADSIIFALPTQATANAMLERMDAIASILFERPNLILAHGNARFSGTFRAIRDRALNHQEQDAWTQCCQWLAQSKKRVFLGQIGVCTIDQVLISVLPVRHRFVRGFGIGRSVLIVDEVHAYDAYMYGLLEEVLRAQAWAGAPAILLSATLPRTQKARLLTSYAREACLPDTETEAYPLITWASADQQAQWDLASVPAQLPETRKVWIECRYTENAEPDNTVLEELAEASRKGAQVCLICNRVDVAQRCYRTLSGIAQDCQLRLFHARFTLRDRQALEEQVLAEFGKRGDRNQGRILIATQVVEQSLDVDFDLMVTQLCPVDLLFQRLGRLHRHNRPHRPSGFEKPAATVLLPTGEGYDSLAHIYSHTRVMWRTQKHLEQLHDTPLIFPQAYREWIEAVYDESGPDPDEPPWVAEGMEAFEDDTFTRRLKARQMLQWARNASLADNDVNERAVTRDGAMSLTLVPHVSTGGARQLLDGTSYEALPEDERMEALAMNQVSVPESWRRWLDMEPDELGRYWINGSWQGGIWHCQVRHGWLTYSSERGMERCGNGSSD